MEGRDGARIIDIRTRKPRPEIKLTTGGEKVQEEFFAAINTYLFNGNDEFLQKIIRPNYAPHRRTLFHRDRIHIKPNFVSDAIQGIENFLREYKGHFSVTRKKLPDLQGEIIWIESLIKEKPVLVIYNGGPNLELRISKKRNR